MAGDQKIKRRGDDPSIYLRSGVAVTILWFVFVFFFLVSNDKSVWGSTPNEFGDFLAGALAPLAFFWLVIGLLYQGQELRQNQEALMLQHDELKKAVEQYEAQAKAQRGHEKYMRQSVLNETRQIFERDLASISLEAASGVPMYEGFNTRLKRVIDAGDSSNQVSCFLGLLKHHQCLGFAQHNRNNAGKNLEAAIIAEERYLSCYKFGLNNLSILEGGEFYGAFYEKSPFGALYELFCMDLQEALENAQPQDKEQS